MSYGMYFSMVIAAVCLICITMGTTTLLVLSTRKTYEPRSEFVVGRSQGSWSFITDSDNNITSTLNDTEHDIRPTPNSSQESTSYDTTIKKEEDEEKDTENTGENDVVKASYREDKDPRFLDRQYSVDYINHTTESVGTWSILNKMINQEATEQLQEGIDYISNCINTVTEECSNKHFSTSYIWNNYMAHNNTHPLLNKYYEKYTTTPTVTQMCEMNALYLTNVWRTNNHTGIEPMNVLDQILQSYPINLLWNTDHAKIDKETVSDILEKKDVRLREAAKQLCAIVRPPHSNFKDSQDRMLMLTTLEYTEYNTDLAHMLINNNESYFFGVRKNSSMMSSYKANFVYYFTNKNTKEVIRTWANDKFGWNRAYQPVNTWFEISNPEILSDKLHSLLLDISHQSNTDVHPLFIVECVEEGIESVRNSMVQFIYHYNLQKDHQIFFIESPLNSLEDENNIITYLDNNAWPGVYWINRNELDSGGNMYKSPYSDHYFGLKKRSSDYVSSASSYVHRVTTTTLPSSQIPAEFDLRQPTNGVKTLYDVYDQGSCGSCWAISAAEIISVSKCKLSEKECDYPVSAQDILSCIGEDRYGCSGAYMGDALLQIKSKGVTGEDCLPYINGACSSLKANGFNCGDYGEDVPSTISCQKTCSDKTTRKNSRRLVSDVLLLNAGLRGRENAKRSVQIIQEHILKGFPVITGFEIYADFVKYRNFDRVYTHMYSPKMSVLGGHAVVLVGWGVGTDIHNITTNYWIAKNSWGGNWGDNGYFKIVRGYAGAPYVEDEVYGVSIDPSSLLR